MSPAAAVAKSSSEILLRGLSQGETARLPKRMPNNWILKTITFPPDRAMFLPTTVEEINGTKRVLPPRISPAKQKEIRLACKMAGIDAEAVVGLPPLVNSLLFTLCTSFSYMLRYVALALNSVSESVYPFGQFCFFSSAFIHPFILHSSFF